MPHCWPALPKKPFPPAELVLLSQFTTPIYCTSLVRGVSFLSRVKVIHHMLNFSKHLIRIHTELIGLVSTQFNIITKKAYLQSYWNHQVCCSRTMIHVCTKWNSEDFYSFHQRFLFIIDTKHIWKKYLHNLVQ